jgi:hypothetical protein
LSPISGKRENSLGLGVDSLPLVGFDGCIIYCESRLAHAKLVRALDHDHLHGERPEAVKLAKQSYAVSFDMA